MCRAAGDAPCDVRGQVGVAVQAAGPGAARGWWWWRRDRCLPAPATRGCSAVLTSRHGNSGLPTAVAFARYGAGTSPGRAIGGSRTPLGFPFFCRGPMGPRPYRSCAARATCLRTRWLPKISCHVCRRADAVSAAPHPAQGHSLCECLCGLLNMQSGLESFRFQSLAMRWALLWCGASCM